MTAARNLTIDEMISALRAQRKAHGGKAQVVVVSDAEGLGLAIARDGEHPHHVARDTGTAAMTGLTTPTASGDALEHGLYLTARAFGDARAVRNGRIGNRLARRYLTKHVWGKAMRRLG